MISKENTNVYETNIYYINKEINNILSIIKQENNICLNKIGNYNNDINNILKKSFNNNIIILKSFKKNLIEFIEIINMQFKYYSKNINIIQNISNNKFVKNLKINENNKKYISNNKKIVSSKVYYNITKNVKCKFNRVTNINQISPCISWFEGNGIIKKGLYICIYDRIYLKLKLSSFSKKENPIKVFRCPHKTKKKCNKNKKKEEKCINIHYGDKINKLEYDNKIINSKFFGNPYNFNKKIKEIDLDSIKILTSYLSGEILALYCWYYFNKSNNINNNIIIDNPFILSKSSK